MEGSERINPVCAPRFPKLRALALAVIVGGAGSMAAQSARALAPIELGAGAREHVPAVSVFAVVALLSLCILVPAATRLVGKRGATVVSLALVAFAPLVIAAALVRLDVPLVSWWWGARVSGPALLLSPVFVAAGIAGTIISVVAARSARPRIDRILGVSARIAAGIGALLFVVAFVRGRRFVDPSGFVDSLDLVEILQNGPRSRSSEGRTPIGTSGDLSAWRECPVHVFDPGHTDACELVISYQGIELPAATSFDVGRSNKLSLRRDAAHGFFVLDEEGRRRRALDATGRPVDITVADVAERLAPPAGWIIVAGLGLAIAAIALLSARRARHDAALVASGSEGMLDDSRWIHVEGEAPLRAPDAIANRAGPVVVIADARIGVHSIYRADASLRPASILLGAKSDLVTRFRDAASASSALALAAVVITASPLVASAIRGLLV